MNSKIAPVCPVSRSQPVSGQPGLLLPYIPPAVDLPSAIAAANAMAGVLQHPFAPRNNVNPLIPFGQPRLSSNNDGGGKKTRSRWEEKNRKTAIKKFVNPEDDQVWIKVERITEITWVDRARKAVLKFTYGEDGALDGSGTN